MAAPSSTSSPTCGTACPAWATAARRGPAWSTSPPRRPPSGALAACASPPWRRAGSPPPASMLIPTASSPCCAPCAATRLCSATAPRPRCPRPSSSSCRLPRPSSPARPCASTAPPPTPSAISICPPTAARPPGTASPAPSRPRPSRRSDACHPGISRSEISGTQGRRVWPWVPALGLTPSAGMTKMAIIQSNIDPNSQAFRANRRDMLALIEQFRALETRVRDTSNQKLPMFQKRGQLTPRQRLAHLIDRGSPFLELSTLAGLNMHDDDGAENIQGGGVIAGIGYVSGARSMITASDSGIKGGTTAPMGLRKSLRVQEIVMHSKLPFISLVESGGANLNYQAEIFVDGGRTFANMARMSAMGIPHIAVVHGSSTAGGAYHPGLSDYVVVVKK